MPDRHRDYSFGLSVASKKLFIAAGGTGGHLFPALYIANALRRIDPSISVIGIGAGRPLEEKIFSSADISYEIIPTVGIKDRGVQGLMRFCTSLPKAIYKTIVLFVKHRPLAVVGVGGYVTVLPILLAWIMKTPTVIHEAEIKPGLANSFLCFFANRVTSAFQKSMIPRWANSCYTGHPVRSGLEAARRTMALPENISIRNILVLGGSQGAQSLDDTLPLLDELIQRHTLDIWHQCRRENVETVQENYRQRGIKARVVPFIDDVVTAYTWADIIISRSGAGLVSELSVVNKPAIFIPFPFHRNDHQTQNAKTLVDIGKASLCPEGSEFKARLANQLQNYLDIKNYNHAVLLPPAKNNQHAAEQIAEIAFSLIVRS